MAPDELQREAEKLERAFFGPAEVQLPDALKVRTGPERRRDDLAEVVRLKDKAFLDRLVALGVRPDTALAFWLVPIVFVAWADGEVDERERAAILKAAAERGVVASALATRMLQSWLSRKPAPGLLEVWKKYASRLWGYFTPDEQWRMRQNVLHSAREVAEAAGGFLGLTSRISAAERAVIEDLERILS